MRPTFRIGETALGALPFEGIGVEADCFIYDETNRQCGVSAQDIDLIERRLKALRPAVSRLFVDVRWVNPSLDGLTMEWGNPYYGHLTRQLKLLDSIGARINLVLFEPYPTLVKDPAPLVHAMVRLIAQLRSNEGIQGIRWLTLYNEPDGMFLHDSPLSRRVFRERRGERPPFSEYVRINRLALELLKDEAMSGIRLLVADTVWGHPMRVERLRLCREAFAEDDVDYSYHNYSAEDPGFYDANPDFAYPGMAAEATLFRQMVGADQRLMLWEFNAAGTAFGSHFPGLGPDGSDLLGSVAAGPIVSGKVLRVMNAGINGVCLWCAHDMVYLANAKVGPMQFGLWRFKWQHWYPRPYYHYYALLCRAFRPGCQPLQVDGTALGIVASAARLEGDCVAGFLNEGADPVQVTVEGPWRGKVCRLRVYPGMIPVEGDLPVAEESILTPDERGTLTLDLQGHELTMVVPPR